MVPEKKFRRWIGESNVSTNPLALVDVLEPLSEEKLERLAHRCPDIRLKKEEQFYRQEEHDSGLFLIKSGRVMVYKLSATGNQLTLVLLSGGTVFTGRRLRGLHARALEPSVVSFVQRGELERLIRESPEVGLRLIDLLADRLSLMDQGMSDVIHKPVRARLASLILQLLDSEGVVDREGYKLTIPYTHEQLGTMIGAKRIAVTKAFGHLREAGMVETIRGRRIYVRDAEALRHTAAEEK
jgi:CRP/FNR family transcriptional regulator, cyclic AMP receptor protein